MSAPTEVELYFVKGKIERWLRFGKPISERTLDRRRRIATFAPGAHLRLHALGRRMGMGRSSRASTFCAPARRRALLDRSRRQARRGDSVADGGLGEGSARPARHRRRRSARLLPQEFVPTIGATSTTGSLLASAAPLFA